MKKICTYLILLSSQTFAQVNLVPNPSFENIVYCPTGTNQIDACANWLNFGNSPDYFNACNSAGMNVPNSIFGFQYAHGGQGMAGLITYRKPTSPNGPNYREFVGVQLLNQLQTNQKYYFSFYSNFANTQNVAVASDKIGLLFSTASFDSCCHPVLNNFAHLYTDTIISDSIVWFRLSGSFIADSGYNYLTIGNFFDDLLTDTLILSQFPDYTYYYIDDVCVTVDSIFNETWTGITEQNTLQNSVLFYPNPTSGNLFINSRYPIDFVQLINSLGQVVLADNNIFNETHMLSLSSFSNGSYYIKVKTTKELFHSVVNIIH